MELTYTFSEYSYFNNKMCFTKIPVLQARNNGKTRQNKVTPKISKKHVTI